MNITRLQHLLLYFLLVWVSGCLAVCVKCDLGVFLSSCGAVKRRCHYNFRFPLFSPLLHWYLLPVTPAITCLPQVLLVIALITVVTCWDICNQFSCILDPIKIREASVCRKQKTLFEGHASGAWPWKVYSVFLLNSSWKYDFCWDPNGKVKC